MAYNHMRFAFVQRHRRMRRQSLDRTDGGCRAVVSTPVEMRSDVEEKPSREKGIEKGESSVSEFVTAQKDLEDLAERLHGSSLLAIDTEFMREKTYYAKLCLLQLNNGEVSALVDPFSVTDLSPLVEILTDPGCTKVFHAGTQDIGILHHEIGVTPAPVFDTQVAASLVGYPLQVGYGPLVRSICGVNLPKADSYTDWAKRPLTKSQMRYALDDVVYLPQIYKTLKAELEAKGRLSWCAHDFEELSDPGNYEHDPYEMFWRVKRVSSLSREQLAIAKEVAAWREIEAMRRNLPRKWVMADEAVIEIARKAPKSKEALLEVRGLNNKLNGKDANQVLGAVKKGMDTPRQKWPRFESSPKGEVQADGAVELLSSLLEVRAKQNDVAAPLIATHSDLSKLARGHREGLALMEGWRYDIAGKELVELLEGKLALCLDDGMIEVIRR